MTPYVSRDNGCAPIQIHSCFFLATCSAVAEQSDFRVAVAGAAMASILCNIMSSWAFRVFSPLPFLQGSLSSLCLRGRYSSKHDLLPSCVVHCRLLPGFGG
jgi:hypothetical protein